MVFHSQFCSHGWNYLYNLGEEIQLNKVLLPPDSVSTQMVMIEEGQQCLNVGGKETLLLR